MNVSATFADALATTINAWSAKVDARDKMIVSQAAVIADLKAQINATPAPGAVTDTGPDVDAADTAAVIAAMPAPDAPAADGGQTSAEPEPTQPSANDLAAAGEHQDPPAV